jgi:putative FmdB family regulatory protein
MPIYDYECMKCGHVRERYANTNTKYLKCPKCQGNSKRIITASGVYMGNNDADWLKSVREVVGDETREGREFKRNPTRANHKAWMKRKGLRPYEPGEPIKPSAPDTSGIHKKVLERHIKRNRLEI